MNMSINERGVRLVKQMISEAEELNINVYDSQSGSKILDCGVKTRGSMLAGLYMTRVSAGDLLQASVTAMDYDGLTLPAIHISSDHPTIATICAQYGDWEIKVGRYYAIGSGPARALALNRRLPTSVATKRRSYEDIGYSISSPREVYERIKYSDSSEEAVIVLESQRLPTDDVILYISKECNVEPKRLYAVVAPTTSMAGVVQVAGRVVEVGIHKLGLLGFDLTKILFGSGYAPVPPIYPDLVRAMGMVNDVIRYAGATFYVLDFDDDSKLEEIVNKVPACNSKDYDKFFEDVFKDVHYDFHGVDLGIFAPATITVNNVKTGKIIKVGKINVPMLKKSLRI